MKQNNDEKIEIDVGIKTRREGIETYPLLAPLGLCMVGIKTRREGIETIFLIG